MKKEINYIGCFLTFRCNLGCHYCLNTQGDFTNRKELRPEEWMEVLKDVKTRDDLPITLQGGEPTMYPGFYELVSRLHTKGHRIDLLTNGEFDLDEFLTRTSPVMFKRPAPYASIRFSLHQNTKPDVLLETVRILKEHGYSVGIWGIRHPDMFFKNAEFSEKCEDLGIDYREKEYLDSRHGTYKYPDAIKGKKNILVKCYPSEMLFAPDGTQYPCHHFLYSGSMAGKIRKENDHVVCQDFGLCNPCDVKLKTNRLQEGGHCSVRIERI